MRLEFTANSSLTELQMSLGVGGGDAAGFVSFRNPVLAPLPSP